MEVPEGFGDSTGYWKLNKANLWNETSRKEVEQYNK